MATRLISSYKEETSKLAELRHFEAAAFTPGNDRPREICDFVLALALVFNDFKDVLLAFSLHVSQPPEDRVDANTELGQFGGIQIHLFRLLTGVLWELMALIQKHKKVLADKNFQRLTAAIGRQSRRSWATIVDVADGQTKSPKDELTSFLLLVRNQAAFHYDAKKIGRAFRAAFASGDLPFVSAGANVAQTRYYFADRAAQYLIDEIAKAVVGKEDGVSVGDFFLRHQQLFTDVGRALSQIVNQFIEERSEWRRLDSPYPLPRPKPHKDQITVSPIRKRTRD